MLQRWTAPTKSGDIFHLQTSLRVLCGCVDNGSGALNVVILHERADSKHRYKKLQDFYCIQWMFRSMIVYNQTVTIALFRPVCY